MKKWLLTGILAMAFSLSMGANAFAGTWQLDANGWWYDNGDGTWPAGCWLQIDEDGDGIVESYYFDQDGYYLMTGEEILEYLVEYYKDDPAEPFISPDYEESDSCCYFNAYCPVPNNPDGAWQRLYEIEVNMRHGGVTVNNVIWEKTDHFLLDRCSRKRYIDLLSKNDSASFGAPIIFGKDDLEDHGNYYELKNQPVFFTVFNGIFDENIVVYEGDICFYKNSKLSVDGSVTFDEALEDRLLLERNSDSFYNGKYHWTLWKPDKDGFFTIFSPFHTS